MIAFFCFEIFNYATVHLNVIYFLFAGAGGEIGGGTAVDICKWGGKVALIDIHEGRLRETVEKCQQAGAARGDILDRVGDCTNTKDVELFFEAVSKKFGKVNALVNVVGTKRIKTPSDMWTRRSWVGHQWKLEVHVFGHKDLSSSPRWAEG